MTALIIVNGPPGSGKTTLAKRLSTELGVPLIHKDGLKVVLYDELGWGGRERDRELGRAALSLMLYLAETHLEVGRSVLLESNFRADLAEPLRELASRHRAKTVQVRCSADRDLLLSRVRTRAGSPDRHPGHCDTEWLEADMDAVMSSGAALQLGGTLIELDTAMETSALEFERILDRIKAELH